METMPEHAIDIGALDDLPAGKFARFEIGGVDVGVIRLPNGEVRAIRNFCPHKGAPICRGIVGGTWPPSEPGKLEFDRAGEVLVCPWHGFEYDLDTGEELFREKGTRLIMYVTTVLNGRVFVDVSRRTFGAHKK
jgi:nitrite reductase (NADH) small subunit